MLARALNSIGVCFNHESRNDRGEGNRINRAFRSRTVSGNESPQAWRRCTCLDRAERVCFEGRTTTAVWSNRIISILAKPTQFTPSDESRSYLRTRKTVVREKPASAAPPPRYRATSSCRRLNGPSLRNRAPGEIIATATADLNTAAGFAIGYFQIHPRPDAGAHRDAQSPPTPIVATAGQDPVDWHVAASPGNAAATIAGGPDQSSPRSRSSRRMGSGIAATVAAAALPRSDGAAS